MDQVNSMVMIKLMMGSISLMMMMTTTLQITMKLEQIYTTVDWPFKNASMNASLFQLGLTDFASHLIIALNHFICLKLQTVFVLNCRMCISRQISS